MPLVLDKKYITPRKGGGVCLGQSAVSSDAYLHRADVASIIEAVIVKVR